MAKKNGLSSGLTAVGIGILLIFVSQYVQILNCPVCQSCSGWSMFSLDCQKASIACGFASVGCASQAVLLNEILLGAGVILLLYGIFKMVM